MKYRKKPVVVEAWKCEAPSKMPNWLYQAMEHGSAAFVDGNVDSVYIHTLEGTMRANSGDWIIRGIKGELYPIKGDIFAATYEVAE